MKRVLVWLLTVGLFGAAHHSFADTTAQNSVTLLSTTSTENSGLLDWLLPQFETQAKIKVYVVAVGTGQAIRSAKDGNGDLLMVHDPESEAAFIASGYGTQRHPFMYNDYLIVGPYHDPAGIKDVSNIEAALGAIFATKSLFLSRGDESGTHKKEMRLWRLAKIDPTQASGEHYRNTGAGMGKTLNIAAATDAYTLTDRGTWLSFNNKQNLVALFEGDPPLFNQYSTVQINAGRHPHINATGAEQLVNWLVSPQGQAAIGAFRIGGEQLFYPNYEDEYER